MSQTTEQDGMNVVRTCAGFWKRGGWDDFGHSRFETALVFPILSTFLVSGAQPAPVKRTEYAALTADTGLLFHARLNNQPTVQKGSKNKVWDSYLSAPIVPIYEHDNGGGLTATGVAADKLYDKASAIIIPSYDKAPPTTSPNRVLALIE